MTFAPAVVGAAPDEPGGVPLHNSRYDFNNALLPVGARYFAELVRQKLPAGGV